MKRIVAIAPQCTVSQLLQSNKVLSDLLHSRIQAGARQQASNESDSPLRPQHLDYSPQSQEGPGGRKVLNQQNRGSALSFA